MRKHTYIAAIWQWDTSDRSYRRITAVHNLGSDLGHAWDRARDMLPVKEVEGTRYTIDRELQRAPYAVIERRETRRTPGGRLVSVIVGKHETIEPDAWIVPSVGELGWTP